MRIARLVVALTCLVVLAACGGGAKDDATGTAETADTTETTETMEIAAAAKSVAADTAAATADTTAPTLTTEGYLNSFVEADFRIYLPAGCGGLSEQISNGATPRAEREFIYTCDRDGAMGSGVRIRVYKQAHDEDGAPPNPRMVTELVKNHLRNSGTRILRQRPLSAAGIEGVDVQAGEDGGPGETWVRGLLAGSDIFILIAWDKEGGLYENPEIADFFASFRVGAK